MTKPWEVKLSKDELESFSIILRNLKEFGRSSLCPFNPDTCNRSKPTCFFLIKGLKRNDNKRKLSCPCYKFRTKSLIVRITKLLKYNNQ